MIASKLHPLLLATMLCILTKGQAQGVHVQWGEPIKQKRSRIYQGAVQVGDSSYLMIQNSDQPFGQTTHFVAMNHNLEKTTTTRLAFPGSSDEKRDLLALIRMSDTIWMVSTSFHPDSRQFEASVHQLGPSGIPVGRARLLCAVDIPIGEHRGRFRIRLSENRQHILIYHEPQFAPRDQIGFTLWLFNPSFENTWSRHFDLPFERRLFVNWSALLTNQGRVFYYGKRYDDKPREVRHGEVNSYYAVVEIPKSSPYPTIDTLDIGNRHVVDFEAIETPVGILFAGLYGRNPNMEVHGYFSGFRDSIQGWRVSNIEAFGGDIKATLEDASKPSRPKEGVHHLSISDLIARRDGGVVLVTQRSWSQTRMTPGIRADFVSQDRLYFTANAWVACLDRFGQNLWQKSISFRQQTMNDGGLHNGLGTAVFGDRLILSYNDHASNSAQQPAQFTMTSPSRSILRAVSIDSKGHSDYHVLGAVCQRRMPIPIPSRLTPIAAHRYLLWSQSGKRIRLASMSLKP